MTKFSWGHRGIDRILVGFTTTCANIMSLNPAHGEVDSIQNYVIKLVSDLWQGQ